jgi:hypothetical protein
VLILPEIKFMDDGCMVWEIFSIQTILKANQAGRQLGVIEKDGQMLISW